MLLFERLHKTNHSIGECLLKNNKKGPKEAQKKFDMMYLPLDRHGQSTGRMFQTYIEQLGLYTEVQPKQSSSDSQLRKSHQTAFALHKFSTDPPYHSTNRGDGPWLTGEPRFPSIEIFFFSSFFFWSFLYILNPL
jgi:hypothetical protein